MTGSRQREWLAVWADFLGAKIEYIELDAPKMVLLKRVEEDYRKGGIFPLQLKGMPPNTMMKPALTLSMGRCINEKVDDANNLLLAPPIN